MLLPFPEKRSGLHHKILLGLRQQQMAMLSAFLTMCCVRGGVNGPSDNPT
jgi:hypothetical protein